jgi:hypothetical protein
MHTEPLRDSCDWMAASARWTCRDGCAWYHGTWQWLRLLGLVSNPSWHGEFFRRTLQNACADVKQPRVLVSGCADYSMYAHVAAALGSAAEITALDRCRTPLVGTDWYASRAGLPAPALLEEDALVHAPDEPYDAVVSDSFLPRFGPDELTILLAAWRKTIRYGGVVVTTVRIHDRGAATATGRGAVADRWRRVALESEAWWPQVSDVPVAELADRVAEFARRQERNAVYDAADLVELFTAAGFDDASVETADVAGKAVARLTAR